MQFALRESFSEKLRNFVSHNVSESIRPICVVCETRRVINLHANKIREMAVNGCLNILFDPFSDDDEKETSIVMERCMIP